ncbi:MAG: UvrB/UvrC motif-containing protein [Endomicrobiia bacterium]
MLCDVCHKNEATIHFKGIFNDQVFKINLCEECAMKKGVEIKPEFALSEFISTLSDLDGFDIPKEKKQIVCKTCGLKYSEFKESGRLGCSNCYSEFANYLTPLLEKIHGSTKYNGNKSSAVQIETEKIIRIQTLKQKYQELKDELKEAVNKELYEKAAEIRDQLKELKRKILIEQKNNEAK